MGILFGGEKMRCVSSWLVINAITMLIAAWQILLGLFMNCIVLELRLERKFREQYDIVDDMEL